MKIKVCFSENKAKIKPLHGVGQPPFIGSNFSMFKYLTDAGIPYSRLHDVGGPYGGGRWVDVPNIFRNFDADEYDENSYDFTFTDLLISALVKSNVEPFFRLGVTIENDVKIKAYRIYPPKDFKKWAIICEHIIRHYTEGWANGFNYNIKYWEIWNEADNHDRLDGNQMWQGTKEQFFELYDIASKHLKAQFPHLKIGGYASCGFYSLTDSLVAGANSGDRTKYFTDFFEDFLKYIKKSGAPLDFFSWHSYDSIEYNKIYAKYAREKLDEYGYTDTETSLNEWNLDIKERGQFSHAAKICGMMLTYQYLPVDNAMFYDARLGVSIYGSLFNPLTREPFPAYFAFRAFNELYKLGTQVECSIDGANVYAAAATDGENGCIVIANTTDCAVSLDLTSDRSFKRCIITGDGMIEESISVPTEIPPYSFITLYTA